MSIVVPKEDQMESTPLLDRAGRRRSPATLSSFHQGRPPRNKGMRHPADPPTVEEIIAVMRAAGESPEGVRLRGVIVVLWRAGLRISEALALAETDLDRHRGALLIRAGKGGKRREVGMDRRGWEGLDPLARAPRRSCPSAHCSAFCAAPPGPAVRSRRHPDASCTTPPKRPASAAGSRHTSSDMPTRSRCPGRASRCWSSNANSSIMPTLRLPRLTYAGSTTPRSSMPFTNDPHR